MSAGASTGAPKTSAPALVVMPKSPTTALPPSSLTTTLRMTSATSLVFVKVQVGASPASTTARTVVSPALKPAPPGEAKPGPLPVPMVITAPFAVQTMFVSVQPDSGVSTTSLVPNWEAMKSNGALAVGLVTAVSRVKVAGRPGPVPVKSKVAVPPTLCFSTSSEAFLVFAYVQIGASPPVMTARTVVSPGSKPAPPGEAKVPPMPVPMVITAPLAAQVMFVSVKPGSGVSWTSLVPSWKPVNANGALVVGLATAVSRVKGARPEPLTA